MLASLASERITGDKPPRVRKHETVSEMLLQNSINGAIGLLRWMAHRTQLGRPKKPADSSTTKDLRAAGEFWRAIARKLGVSVGADFRTAQKG